MESPMKLFPGLKTFSVTETKELESTVNFPRGTRSSVGYLKEVSWDRCYS